ncbi:MAG: S1 RNA-binding domain-containing protein [Bacillota bacterium]
MVVNKSTSLVVEGLTDDTEKKQFTQNAWVEIYAARQNGTILQGTAVAVEEHHINDQTIPCLIVQLGSIKGLIPISEADLPERKEQVPWLIKRDMRNLIGQKVAYKVLTFDRDAELVLLSRKKAREQMAKQTWGRLEEGEPVTCVVRSIGFKKATVDIGGVDAVLKAEEVSWGWTDDMRDVFQTGDAFDVLVTAVNKENKTVEISLKQLRPSPWPDAATRFERNNEYLGMVTGIMEFGVFVNLNIPGVDALCKQPRLLEVIKGDSVVVKITEIDPKAEHINGIIQDVKGRRPTIRPLVQSMR